MQFNRFFLFIGLALSAASCKKYLDAKPDKSLATPSSVADLQALLDRETIMNTSCPSLGETSADNYYLLDADYNSLSQQERSVYVWDTSIYNGGFPNDWSAAYNPVYFANIALENIGSFARTDANATAWDNVKGSALLFRAKSFLDAAWIWAKAYDPSSAANDPGIPLRLSSDFNEKSARSSVQDVYDRILGDLKDAAALLPVAPVHVMRPSKPAAYALIARTYLSMRMYDSCYRYADMSLQLYNQLVDYNTVSTSTTYPMGRFCPEVVMHSSLQYSYSNLINSYAKVDSSLYQSYDDNDLRKTVFFKPVGTAHYYRGSYARSNLFNGLATDENYLMRAECLARKGDVQGAMNDMNLLLTHRYKTGTYTPPQPGNANEALAFVLSERRKELLFRELRWMDIKRLNLEGAAITPVRIVNGQTYTLPLGSHHYELPIPPDIISITGMQQNLY